MLTINIKQEFGAILQTSRDEQENSLTGPEIFREKFLSILDNPDTWSNDETELVLDCTQITKIRPLFIVRAFGYFFKYSNATPDRILNKIKFIGLSNVKMVTIKITLEDQYQELQLNQNKT